MTDLMPFSMPFSGRKRRYRSSVQYMMGQFITSPTDIREYSGDDWRSRSGKYKKWAKRNLSKFRRRDGKAVLLEGLAVLTEQEAVEQAERERLALEYRGFSAWDDEWYDDDGDCSCCSVNQYEDEAFHDGSYYFEEQDKAQEYLARERADREFDSKYDAYWAGRRDAMRDSYDWRYRARIDLIS